MGLYDFDIHDETPEIKKLHDVSADKGRTWTTQWLTPTEILRHRMDGYITRSHYADREIVFTPGNSSVSIRMTIPVPVDRDAEEYINDYLDGMLNENLRYNSDWEFE